MLMVSVDHLKQVLSGRVLMREDERPATLRPTGRVVVPRPHIGRATLLPPLKDQRTNPASRGLLFLQPLMDVLLRPVQGERFNLASLGANL